MAIKIGGYGYHKKEYAQRFRKKIQKLRSVVYNKYKIIHLSLNQSIKMRDSKKRKQSYLISYMTKSHV